MNTLYIKFNESKEAIGTIKHLLENNVRHEGANKIDFYNNFQNQPVFIRLKKIMELQLLKYQELNFLHLLKTLMILKIY